MGYPPIGLLDAMMIEQTKEKRKQLAKLGLHSVTFLDGLTRQPYIPGLNAGALRATWVNEVNEVKEVKDTKRGGSG